MCEGNACSAVVLLLLLATQAAVSQRQALKFAENESLTGTRRTLSSTAQGFFAGAKCPENLPNSGRGTILEQKRRVGPTVYFVSLFDETRNIPFYSAYKVTPDQAKDIGTYNKTQGRSKWRTTPGVKGMDNVYKEAIKICKKNAKGSPKLSRGHMNPSAINSFDRNHMKATYTLSNAVPQFQQFNSKEWGNQEAKIRNYAKNTCGHGDGTLYMLTGISDYGLIKPTGGGKPVQDQTITLQCPEYNFKSEGKDKKLGTPRALWSAGCCVWKKLSTTAPDTAPPAKKARSSPVESFAVMSNNHADKNNLHLTQMSVADLENLLSAPGQPNAVELFPGNSDCGLDKYYTEL